MTMWVGLTGGIGSGKSKAATEFVHLNVPVIDADAISHCLTAKNGTALPILRAHYGKNLFNELGELKRDVLRHLVFTCPEEKSKLESLMFPLIIEQIARQQQQYVKVCYGVIELPLLIGYPQFMKLINRVLVIDVPETMQIMRVQQRNGLSELEIKRIMNNQPCRLKRLRAADDVLLNNGSLPDLAVKVQRLHDYYSAYFHHLY